MDFTLPGYPGIELRKGGRDLGVTLDNLASYISLVSHWLLVEGVSMQFEALREGFNSVFPICNLQMFHPGIVMSLSFSLSLYILKPYHSIYLYIFLLTYLL